MLMDLLTKMTVVVYLSLAAEVEVCEQPGDEACEETIEKQDYPYPMLTAGECGKLSITACCKQDGFGAQYQAMMNIYLHARFTGVLQYCTSEWYGISSDDDPKDLFRWVGGHLYGPRKGVDTWETPLRALLWPVESRNETGKEEVRGFYFSQPKPIILLDKPRHFAIHIRRGDMMELGGIHYITDEQNVEAIVRIKQLYIEDFRRIHIVSDGSEEDLKNVLGSLEANNIEYKLHLKKDVKLKEAFHHMVMTDILVYGPSEFCRSAAFLNGGGLVYHVHTLLSGSNEPTPLIDILPGTSPTDNGYWIGD